MPIDVRIDPRVGVVTRKVTGAVSARELMASFAETIARPDFDPSMKSLMDFSEYEHQLGSDDMRGLAAFFLDRLELVKDVKTAVVVSHTVSYGLVRMLQTYLDATPIKLEVFYDRAEAERWLEIARPEGPDAG